VHLWDDPLQDPQWVAAGFAGDQPFRTVTLFNSFFASDPSLNNRSMLDLVSTGGGGSPTTKAARDVVAAALNAARFGDLYPYSVQEVKDMWAAAVGNNNALKQLHNVLGPANERGCPSLPAAAASQPVVTVARVPLWTFLSSLRPLMSASAFEAIRRQ